MLVAAANPAPVTWTKMPATYLSKWNILFDKAQEWMAFKPQLEKKVYPCYACKNMFSSKLTFQDHVNRRVNIIKYKCPDCSNTLTFYNRCSFLLHTRKHYNVVHGKINLNDVEISLLPMELAGFGRHESIPFLYDEEEEYVGDNVYLNTQFFTPDDTEAGLAVITVKPYNLIFHYAEGNVSLLMVLKQISSNIPLCKFVSYNPANNIIINNNATAPPPLVPRESLVQKNNKAQAESLIEPAQIKQEEIDPNEYMIPIVTINEGTMAIGGKTNKVYCSECLTIQNASLAYHFVDKNKPLDESVTCKVCKYIAPTKCSLAAHCRTHANASPFVCPDCGKMFKNWPLLLKHMDNVCYHTAKQVRFRCPGLKCGKLFVLRNTYASHFGSHLQCVHQCGICTAGFSTNQEFMEHCKTAHSRDDCTPIKTYNCTVCKNLPTLTEDKYSEHLGWHTQDRERCVYIYVCKFCKSYFRSSANYATHLRRCSKNHERGQPQVKIIMCHKCNREVTFKEHETVKQCSYCPHVNQLPSFVHVAPINGNGKVGPDNKSKKVMCMLCKEGMSPDNKKLHYKECKYNNAVVNVQNVAGSEQQPQDSDKVSSSDSEVSDSKKRKRSSGSTTSGKVKRSDDGSSIDLQADDPVSFDGTYYCKVCDYKDSVRDSFHEHIITHRDVSTSYQCMECGECFMVKPSLMKHLVHFHKITDAAAYLSKNDCYDKSAVEDLKNNLKVPGGFKGPFKENQCTVCLEQFEDAGALNKHFRSHGMAFLKNQKT